MRCTFPGCTKPGTAKTLCTAHYRQFRRTGETWPLGTGRPRETATCKVPSCARKAGSDAKSTGYCLGHQQQCRRTGATRQLRTRGPQPLEQVGEVTFFRLFNKMGQEVGKVLVAPEDAARVGAHRWSRSGKYVATNNHGKPPVTLLHRFIMDAPEDRQIDHINGNPWDNRRENLRLVTRAEQAQNHRTRAASGHRNVHYDASRARFRVALTVEGKRHQGKDCLTLEEAAEDARRLRSMHFTHHVEHRCVTAPDDEDGA